MGDPDSLMVWLLQRDPHSTRAVPHGEDYAGSMGANPPPPDLERQLNDLIGAAAKIGEYLKALVLLERLRMQDDLSYDHALTVGRYNEAMAEVDRILADG